MSEIEIDVDYNATVKIGRNKNFIQEFREWLHNRPRMYGDGPKLHHTTITTQYSFYVECPRCGSENFVQWDHSNDHLLFIDAESDVGEYASHICTGDFEGEKCSYEIPFEIDVETWIEFNLKGVRLDMEQIKSDFPEIPITNIFEDGVA